MLNSYNILTAIFIFTGTSLFSQTPARLVLIEQFTNSGCSICANNDHWVTDFTDNNPSEAVEISYHTWFPYSDSMYFENSVENNARTNYYSIPATPWSVIDGNYYNNGTSSLGNGVGTTVAQRKMTAPDYTISSSSLSLSGNTLSGTIIFESIDSANTAKNLRAHVVVIEKNVLKSSYAASPGGNSQTVYKNVMRKMISGAAGTVLANKNLNGKDSINFSWNLLKIKNANELAVVCFVQDEGNKEVLQAASFVPLSTGIQSLQTGMDLFYAFPNPASGAIYLASDKNTEDEFKLEVYDISGRKIRSQKIILSQKPILENIPDLNPGLYYWRLTDSAGHMGTKKILVD
jgi:hypothetical protein